MAYTNPEKQRAAGRESARRRRAAAKEEKAAAAPPRRVRGRTAGESNPSNPVEPVAIERVTDLQRHLAVALAAVQAGQNGAVAEAKVITSIVQQAMRLIEIGDHEDRLTAIEQGMQK